MRTDCTEIFNRFRDLARLIWNVGFRPIPALREPTYFLTYRELCARLFESIVGLPLGLDGKIQDVSRPGDLTKFHVTLKTPAGRWMVNTAPERHCRYWEESRLELDNSNSYEFRFINYFDWDQQSHRDYAWIEVLIVRLDAKPEWQDRHALLEATECIIFVDYDLEGY